MNGDILWTVLFGAIVVEAIVNIVRNLKLTRDPVKDSPGVLYWASLGVGLVIGLVVALNYDLDVFALVGIEGRVPFVGAILTGLIISRGANIVSDILGRLNAWKTN